MLELYNAMLSSENEHQQMPKKDLTVRSIRVNDPPDWLYVL